MARPRKWRKVCAMPDTDYFGPTEGFSTKANTITMTVDEYESIRLIDHLGLTQAECSKYMDISRTSVQSTYNSARKKLAVALIEGKFLLIEGGDYQLCGENKCTGELGNCPFCQCHSQSESED